MRIARRATGGFNLAFLDIMACGLGAIILLFMLVKDQASAPSAELEMLQADLSAARAELRELEDAARDLSARNRDLQSELQSELESAEKSGAEAGGAAQEIIDLAKEIARLESEKAAQRRRLEQPQTAPAGDGAEKHLLGLRVEGDFILILLDSSASMADERLVDIVRIKAQDTAAKRAAPKWQRALATVQWIMERVPEGSRYMIVEYNEKADFVLEKWLRGGDDNARAEARQALEKLHPHGGTNLQAALEFISARHIPLDPADITDIYVITDSLPTKGKYLLPQRFACGRSKITVSGECRRALMYSAIKSFQSNARVNTVLLPVEGDPDAAYAYWVWAASTTGTMISPGNAWP